jgi:hypothetical protein
MLGNSNRSSPAFYVTVQGPTNRHLLRPWGGTRMLILSASGALYRMRTACSRTASRWTLVCTMRLSKS